MFTDILALGEWLPDQAPLEAEGAQVAKNVLVDGATYRPVKSLTELSDDLGDRCYGAYSYVDPSGNVTNFAATRTKIFKLNGTSWDDVTNTGGDYATASDGAWNFTQFGSRIIATNYVDKIQTFEVGADTEFSDLITSGPDVKCRNFGIVNNFLVTIDVFDSDGATQNRVRWSPINNPTGDWTASQSTQADFQDVEDGNPGQGMAVIGSQNYGILIFKNAIYRMEYVGPPTIFQFSLVETNRGAINGQAVASDGVQTFYYSENGFYLFNGSVSAPIGHKKIDSWFADDIDDDNAGNIRATLDPANKNFLLSYTSVNSVNSRNDKVIAYNWADNKFTLIDQATDVIYRGFTEGLTLDEIGATYSSIETVPYSLDSRFWVGGATQLSAFNEDNKLSFFDGDPLAAEIESQELKLNKDGITRLNAVFPSYSGGTIECRVGHRMTQNGTVNYTPYTAPNASTDECNYTIDARLHRIGVRLSGDWEQFKGVSFQAEAAGGI